MKSDQQTHKQDFQTQARWALGGHSALEIWRCAAQARLRDKDPLGWRCRLLAEDPGGGCWPRTLEVGAGCRFANQESSKSVLHVVCLAKDPGKR